MSYYTAQRNAMSHWLSVNVYSSDHFSSFAQTKSNSHTPTHRIQIFIQVEQKERIVCTQTVSIHTAHTHFVMEIHDIAFYCICACCCRWNIESQTCWFCVHISQGNKQTRIDTEMEFKRNKNLLLAEIFLRHKNMCVCSRSRWKASKQRQTHTYKYCSENPCKHDSKQSQQKTHLFWGKKANDQFFCMFLKENVCQRQSKWPKLKCGKSTSEMYRIVCALFNIFQFQIKWIGTVHSFVQSFCCLKSRFHSLNVTSDKYANPYTYTNAGEVSVRISLMATIVLLFSM